jgi:hypothetical protein
MPALQHRIDDGSVEAHSAEEMLLRVGRCHRNDVTL